MNINMQGFRIKNARLKNESLTDQMDLEITYNYSCDVSEEEPRRAQCILNLQVYTKENAGEAEKSPLYISAEFLADFTAEDKMTADDVSPETLRLLFPFVQSYIVQLTTSAFMPPLYLPDFSNNEATAKEQTQVKKPGKARPSHHQKSNKN